MKTLKKALLLLALATATAEAQSKLKTSYDAMTDTTTIMGSKQYVSSFNSRDIHLLYFSGKAEGNVQHVDAIQFNVIKESPVRSVVDLADSPATPPSQNLLILVDDSIRIRLIPSETRVQRTKSVVTGVWDKTYITYQLSVDQVRQLMNGQTFKTRVADSTWDGVPGRKELENLSELCNRSPSCIAP